MPPKRKAAAAPKPLADCTIAFAYARFPAAGVNGTSLADYQSNITACGGQYTAEVDQCSHLVATEAQYKKKPARLTEAVQKDDVAIVSFDWLEQSLTSKARVDEVQYLLHSRDTNSQADAANGSKRVRSASIGEEEEESSTTKKIKSEANDTSNGKDTHSTKSGPVNIPLDEYMPDKDSYKVHTDDDGTVYDVTLNQTNAGANNNKFYRIQLVSKQSKSFWCWTRWGRVGEKGQMKMLGNGDFDLAFKEFQKKFKDKNGNNWDNRLDPIKSGKYSYIERSYEDSSDEEEAGPSKAEKRLAAKGQLDSEDEEKPVESKLPEPVQRLMQLIFNQQYFDSTLASLDYDATKMPLGKLSKNTLLRGYTVLKDLASLVSNTSTSSEITDKSNQYFSLIPHAFGRNRPPVLNSMVLIKKEITLLESLTDMQLANEIMKEAKGKKGAGGPLNVLDRQYSGLGMQEMTPLASSSTEFKELQGYLTKSSGATHNMGYKVQDIFRIERQGEYDRFDKSKFGNIPNTDRRLLWHGSRCTNFGGILSQGLRIAPPEAPVTGYMFGKGVYLADMSSKSANYCASYTSGGVGLLLLCEAELGTPPFRQTNANYNAGTDAAKQGAISTLGVGRTAPQGWKDAGCLHDNLKGVLMPDVLTKPPGDSAETGAYLQYNEYIIYDVAQIKLRYLFRVAIN